MLYFIPFSMLFDMLDVTEELMRLSEAITIPKSTELENDFYAY